jgi:hypothetical protein
MIRAPFATFPLGFNSLRSGRVRGPPDQLISTFGREKSDFLLLGDPLDTLFSAPIFLIARHLWVQN